jgi:hypothetical protein
MRENYGERKNRRRRKSLWLRDLKRMGMDIWWRKLDEKINGRKGSTTFRMFLLRSSATELQGTRIKEYVAEHNIRIT